MFYSAWRRAAARYLWGVTEQARLATGQAAALLPEPFLNGSRERGWSPRAHQIELLAKAQAGKSVLLIAPTGAGKTLAGFLPSLTELAAQPKRRPGEPHRGIHTLYISPLKALAVDIERNLGKPVGEMGLPLDHGDPHRRHAGAQAPAPEARAARHPAHHARAAGAADRRPATRGASSPDLRYVVLDELHSLVTSKRGHLLALGLARLRRFEPGAADDRPVGDGLRAGRAAALAGRRRTRPAHMPN